MALAAVVGILLVQANPTWWFVIPTMVIVGREIAISALREWMAEIGERAQVAVSQIGKIKTTVQMISLFLLLYRDPLGPFPTAPIVEYLARSLSAFYALHGVITLVISTDVPRYRPLIGVWAWSFVALGLITMLIFIVLLLDGLVYAWKRGLLRWV